MNGTVRVVALLLGLAAGSAQAFKMGHEEEYRAVEDRTIAGRDAEGHTVYERTQGVGSKFGDAIHEDMTLASLKLARQRPGELLCKVSAQDIERFARKIDAARVGNRVCCDTTAKSIWCNGVVDRVRYTDFPDRLAPLIAGTRWPDDPCHMSVRPDTVTAWAAWMVDPGYRRYANANYSSHYHHKQFLHAMKSVGFGSNKNNAETPGVTQHKLMTWAEFAMKVANGTIPSTTALTAVPPYLEPGRQKAYNLGFSGYGKASVGRLFAGTKGAPDPDHVRQIALGALLHTVQDSFSLSHANREHPQAARLKDRGRITGFRNYRDEIPSEHGAADARPPNDDGTTAELSDAHPVAYGAHLIACAASTDDRDANWLKLKPWLRDQVFAIGPPTRQGR